jgi:peptidoglycan/LPS O-acetylase OafA/YrhL
MKIKFLDGLRGIAALYVMIGHARWLLWEGYQDGYLLHRNDYSIIDKGLMYFFYLFRYGHECVLFFFVLSGFVIHISYVKQLKQDPKANISFLRYFNKRVNRIYPPFLFALFITICLDFAGRNYNFLIYYGKTSYPLINSNFGHESYGVYTFIGNILFLFPEYFPFFGTNKPTWSLQLEWWFYLIYPSFLVLSRKHIYYSTSLIVALFIFSFFPAFWPEKILQSVFSIMITWWLGVLLAEIYSERLKIKLIQFFFVSCISFAILSFFNNNNALYDFKIAFLFSALLSLLLWLTKKGIRFSFLEKLKVVGDFSYTLYIIHCPILIFLSGMVMKYSNNKLPKHSFYVIGGIVICVLISYIAHFFVEIPFRKPNMLFKQSI